MSKKGNAYQQLHLPHLEEALPQLLAQARNGDWTYEIFLAQALATEIDGREQQALARRLKAARIPAKKSSMVSISPFSQRSRSTG
jgi:DNA replication protein DnaC